VNRAAYYAARHAFRTFDRAERQHAADQVMADQRQLFREYPPMHYWLMATFVPKRGDALLTARNARPLRADRLRLSRASRAEIAARNAVGLSKFSPAFRGVLDSINRNFSNSPKEAA
jgi:hypothetical protein